MQVAADDLGSQLLDCRHPPGVVTWTGRDCNRLWFQTQGDVQGGVGDLAAPFTQPITVGHQNHSYLLFRLPLPGQPAGAAPASHRMVPLFHTVYCLRTNVCWFGSIGWPGTTFMRFRDVVVTSHSGVCRNRIDLRLALFYLSVLKMSASAFHWPSFCFFQTTTYFPGIGMEAPLSSLSLSSKVPTS